MKKSAKKSTKKSAKKTGGGSSIVKTELVEVPAYSYRRKVTPKQQKARESFTKSYGNKKKSGKSRKK